MSSGSFQISYKISSLGALDGKDARQLPMMDITNYSLQGEMEIAADDGKIVLVEVPLLEVFHAIRQTLKIVPIFTRSAPYQQMFREARTVFTVESDLILIEHKEIPQLRQRSGSARVSGSYVGFCTSFGASAKNFVRELEKVAPSLFSDEKTTAQFGDLFVGAKIKDIDPSVYSVI
ncbi:MAG: hypothetical protein WDM91_23080 [Rhizomicrobium sp.]